jgi:hypothetical protein
VWCCCRIPVFQRTSILKMEAATSSEMLVLPQHYTALQPEGPLCEGYKTLVFLVAGNFMISWMTVKCLRMFLLHGKLKIIMELCKYDPCPIL